MNKRPLVVFSHGKESGPWGSKIQALADIAKKNDFQVISIDYRKLIDGQEVDQNKPNEADRRVKQLLDTPLPEHSYLILVGSSMGGYVSTIASASLNPIGLFLLAPAFYVDGYEHQHPQPTSEKTLIIHGWNDDVIPYQNSVKFAANNQCVLHLLNGDHRLNDALDEICNLFELFLNQVSAIPKIGN